MSVPRTKFSLYKRLALFFLFVPDCLLVGQPNLAIGELPADSVYLKAELLFNSEVPTTIADQESVKLYQEAASLYEGDSVDFINWADCYRKIGIIHLDAQKYELALRNFQEAARVRKLSPILSDSLYFEDYLYSGNANYSISNLDSAEYYYQIAENLTLKYPALKKRGELYNSLGSYYFAVGNYQLANQYLQASLRAVDASELEDEVEQNIIRSNIAITEEKLGHYTEAIANFKLLLQSGLDTQFLYNNIGNAFIELHQYDSAVHYLKKALYISNRGKHVKNATLNNLGNAYTYLNNLDTAMYYYRASISLNDSLFTNRNFTLANAYYGIGLIEVRKSNLDSALYYYQKALTTLSFAFEDQRVFVNPENFTDVISLPLLFSALQQKAGVFEQIYEQNANLDYLNHSLTTYQLAIRVAQHIQKTYDNDEAKLFLVNKVAPVYEEAIATAVQLHQLTDDPRYVAQAFQFSEASKAAVLTESLRDVKIKSSGQVSDSLVQDEHRLKQQITALRLKLVESQDSVQNETYRQELIDQEIALARTIKYLQKDEHYYQRKYQPDSLNIAALQKSLLTDNETLLEYFVGQREIYVFALRRGDLQVASVARTAELDSALQRTRQHLYDYQPGQGEDAASLETLYRYLIAPVADAVADAHKLIVVPDGPLHYLPFDLLSVDGQRTNYLLHTHTLHYGYSASLLQQAIDERRGYPTETVLAMAPFTGGEAGNVRSQGFSPLRDSQAEVESVGGSIYTEGKATKRRFLRVAGSYNVLHLATHATVNAEDPSQSFIAFYPQQRDSVANYRLYTHELYNMRLDSVKLVILSACEAGNGQLVRGEGVMSLARAFAYAGCPNIITTLWKADDRSSAQLTTRLHQYLKQGWEKDEALRQAKLDYLNDPAVHPAQKAPYYWANFVFIGDPAPIYDNYRWWWLAVGLLLVGGLLRWRRREQRRVKQTA